MRLVPLGVAIVAAALVLAGLGDAPFVDPPEGFHAEIARSMAARDDFVTARLNGVRYFEKPPLMYWLMSASFALGGVSPAMARIWPALAAVGCAAVTARLGTLLGGPRMGLVAGLVVIANLGVFLYARIVKPDLVFILCITLAFAGFATTYLGRGGRWGLGVFYAALAVATLAKDVLGAIGPLAVVGIFFWVTRERPWRPWFPWWGWAVLGAIALPWYIAVEVANPGYLWYLVLDVHVLNLARQRAFPDEDVPLTALEFVAVTGAAFLPWALAAPRAVVRALRRDWATPAERLALLFALWALIVVGFFTFSPFKLPHYGLPAFPALSLLVAALWEETLARRPGAPSARSLVVPIAIVFAVAAAGAAAAWLGLLSDARSVMTSVDVATRNLAARGHETGQRALDTFRPVFGLCAVVFGAGAAAAAVAAWRRSAELGLIAALATMLAFLPAAGRGMVEFARGRSAEPIAAALARRAQPDDLVAHEGALENSASILLTLRRPVRLVDGLASNVAFGSTFADARDVFWDGARLRREWMAPGRHFLVSVVAPDRSVVRALPPESVHLIAASGGRRLYSNRPDAGGGAGTAPDAPTARSAPPRPDARLDSR